VYSRNFHGVRLPQPDTACRRARKIDRHFTVVGMRRSGNNDQHMSLHQNISINIKLQLSFPMYPGHDK
jgi:hypothetical protein